MKLKDFLDAFNGLDPDMIVLTASDAEGNDYTAASQPVTGLFCLKEGRHTFTVVNSEDRDPDDTAYAPCVVIYP